MNKYHIRYNTRHGESEFVWRVFENGVEHLVKHISLQVPVFDEYTLENGIQKWNISCEGTMVIKDDVAIITNIGA